MVSFKRFTRFATVGIANTLVHWLAFLGAHLELGLNQAPSNLLAFMLAASLSYYLNARYTFLVPPNRWRYLAFVLGMGALSLGVGAVADRTGLSPWLTLLSFSGLSPVLGYAYSHTVVFKRRLP